MIHTWMSWNYGAIYQRRAIVSLESSFGSIRHNSHHERTFGNYWFCSGTRTTCRIGNIQAIYSAFCNCQCFLRAKRHVAGHILPFVCIWSYAACDIRREFYAVRCVCCLYCHLKILVGHIKVQLTHASVGIYSYEAIATATHKFVSFNSVAMNSVGILHKP